MDPYEPPAPGAAAPERPPAPPEPGWGNPGPGWGAPPVDPVDPARGRRRSALWLGVVSLVLLVAGIVTAFLGVPLLLFGGAGLLLIGLGALLALAGVGLAVASVVSALRARGGPATTRLLSVVPAAITVTIVGLLAGSFVIEDRTTTPPVEPPRPRPLSAGAPPVRVVETVGELAGSLHADDICTLLAARVRGPRCERVNLHSIIVDDVRLVRASDSRAVVSYTGFYERGDSRHRVRLVREAEGWQLLDLPGVRGPDPCLDVERDPFTCAVEVVGAPLASPG